MKNTIAATNVPDSIPFVIVMPINTPSHTNATIPEIGISIAQKMYSPDAEITALARFYTKDDELDLTRYDWIIDAIDDVDAKTELICKAKELGVNIISAMGAAGKFGTDFKVADISKTSVCPLARVMRRRLRDRGIDHLPVVYSEEKPVPRDGDLGTLSYVPGSAGLTLAGYVIRQISGTEANDK